MRYGLSWNSGNIWLHFTGLIRRIDRLKNSEQRVCVRLALRLIWFLFTRLANCRSGNCRSWCAKGTIPIFRSFCVPLSQCLLFMSWFGPWCAFRSRTLSLTCLQLCMKIMICRVILLRGFTVLSPPPEGRLSHQFLWQTGKWPYRPAVLPMMMLQISFWDREREVCKVLLRNYRRYWWVCRSICCAFRLFIGRRNGHHRSWTRHRWWRERFLWRIFYRKVFTFWTWCLTWGTWGLALKFEWDKFFCYKM